MTEPVVSVPAETQESVAVRLRRIEGQVRGIQRMVEEGRDCREIANQIAAVRAALGSLNAVVVECYVRQCLNDPQCSRNKTADELIEMMMKATK
jgi:DNA-binding FrmR family transcriptional regulator